MKKEDLIKMVNERGNIMNICNLTSYVTSHQNEFNFEIENNVLNLADEKIKEAEKQKLINIIDLLKTYTRFFYFIVRVKNNFGHIQYFVNIHEGKNGNGDFVNDDLTNIYTALIKIKPYTKWLSFTDVDVDISDDVSTWGVTFML